jgi:hypothetical protein
MARGRGLLVVGVGLAVGIETALVEKDSLLLAGADPEALKVPGMVQLQDFTGADLALEVVTGCFPDGQQVVVVHGCLPLQGSGPG